MVEHLFWYCLHFFCIILGPLATMLSTFVERSHWMPYSVDIISTGLILDGTLQSRHLVFCVYWSWVLIVHVVCVVKWLEFLALHYVEWGRRIFIDLEIFQAWARISLPPCGLLGNLCIEAFRYLNGRVLKYVHLFRIFVEYVATATLKKNCVRRLGLFADRCWWLCVPMCATLPVVWSTCMSFGLSRYRDRCWEMSMRWNTIPFCENLHQLWRIFLFVIFRDGKKVKALGRTNKGSKDMSG